MKTFLILFSIAIMSLGFGHAIHAQISANNYTLLAPIPLTGASNGPTAQVNINTYIQGAVELLIGIACVLAVLRIIFAGIQYMSTDAFSGKSDAKGVINGAIWGLLLAIASYSILYTLNPNLVTFNFNIQGQAVGSAFNPSLGAATPGTTTTAAGACLAYNPDQSTLDQLTNQNSEGGSEDLVNASSYVEINSKTATQASITALTQQQEIPYDPSQPAGACLLNAPSTTTSSSAGGSCTNCVALTGVPANPPGQACSGTAPCTVVPQLETALQNLTAQLTKDGISSTSWEVTEAYPPEDPDHVSSCHQNGTCVDAALNGNPPYFSDIKTFLTDVTAEVSPSFLYEAPNCTRYNQLISSPYLTNFKSQIAVCKSTTGENVHINLSGSVGGSCGTAADGTSNTVICPAS